MLGLRSRHPLLYLQFVLYILDCSLGQQIGEIRLRPFLLQEVDHFLGQDVRRLRRALKRHIFDQLHVLLGRHRDYLHVGQ